MKTVSCIILIFVLHSKSHSYENNVCETIRDYYTIKDNPNCEYDVAADPDANPITVIQFYGYPAESHQVITLDGYILTMFRIPNDHATFRKGPVLMHNGWMSSSADFLGLRNHSLAFLLADAGYDVWLSNYRGTEYSEGHINLTVHNKQYWDSGGDEIALYDVPAELGYISRATGYKEGIVYIGYSIGAAFGLGYSAAFPEQASKALKMLVLLAPATHLGKTKAPVLTFTRPFLIPLYKILVNNDLVRLTSQGKILKSLTTTVCFESPLLMQLCMQLVYWLFAGPQTQTDPKTFPVVLNRSPAGSSLKIVPQLADFLLGNFRRFDYGQKNIEVYGTYEPPPYDVGRIRVPVFIAHAINDWVVTPKDVRKLYNDLSPAVRYGRYEIRVPSFNHNDFPYGRNAKSIVYDVVLEVLHSIKH